MTAAAAPSAAARASAKRVPVAWVRPALAGVLVVASFAALHPYTGVIADAALYLGRSVADLDPAGVGRDIAFANDGQSRFSIFARLVDPLVAALGVQQASLVIALAASLAMLGALFALAQALTADGRLTVAVMLAAILLPSTYGAGAFRFAEATAVPRPFAEAAVLLAIAALLANRPWRAAACLGLALLIHPLMALAGVGTVLVLVAWRRSARASVAVTILFAALAAAAIALGWLGVPLLDRVFVGIDPEWLAMLTKRSDYLFPTLWDGAAWAVPCVHVTVLALAAQGEAGPARRRVLLAVALSAVLQLAAAIVFGDALHRLLVVQIQGWRALWLLAITASCCLPLVAIELWRAGAQARVALALLGLAALCPLGLPCTVAICVAVLALRRPSIRLSIEARHATWALAAVAIIVVAKIAVGANDWVKLVASEPAGAHIGWLAALRCDLLVAPLGLALAAWLLTGASRAKRVGTLALAALATAAVVLAVARWDERAAADALFARQDGFPAAAAPGPRSSEVFLFGGLSESWFSLGRPQYLSAQQASGIVFSRPLAMEWLRRAETLRALGLVSRDPLLAGQGIKIEAARIAAFCAQPEAPAAVIVPDRDDAPAPSLPGAVLWPAVPPRPILAESQPPRWQVIRGWVVAPCAASDRRALAETERR